MPGLAHFCEHLSFMVLIALTSNATPYRHIPTGNRTVSEGERIFRGMSLPYPQGPLTTLQFLSKNNGSSNAFTSSTNTNYYFDVATPTLADALERFSCFFHSPLFSQSSTVRELNAVDSEQKQNLQNDKRRTFQVDKHLSKPGHVWSKFGTGNKVTLTSAARKLFQKDVKTKAIDGCATFQATSEGPSVTSSTLSFSSPPIGSDESLESSDDGSGGDIGRETRRRLIEWWSKEYCAGRMRLCVIGKGVVSCVWV